MKTLLLIVLLFLQIIVFSQDTPKYFSYDDSVFYVGQIHPIEILFDYNANGIIQDCTTVKSFEDIAAFLKKHSNISISIDVHTDCRGSDKYNLKLTEMRAKGVVNELITKYFVPEDRLSYKGYGESELIFECEGLNNLELDKNIYEILLSLNRRILVRITAVN